MLRGCALHVLIYIIYFDNFLCITLPCNQTYLAKTGYWCYPCSAGYSKISECVVNDTQDRCARCEDGEYQPNCDNSTRCAHCRPFFQPGQVKIKSCTATSDIVCQCRAGYYWKPHTGKPDEGYCKTHSKCGAGEGCDRKGTPYEDTKCVPCRKGVSYSGNVSYDTCILCTVCNTTMVAECTATSNTVCGSGVHQRPTKEPTANDSPTGLDSGIIVTIITVTVAAILVLVTVVVLAIIKGRRKGNTAIITDAELDKVDFSNENADRENGLENSSHATRNGDMQTPRDKNVSSKCTSADGYESTDDSGEGSFKSCSSSQESLEHGNENKVFDSHTELVIKNETENDIASNRNKSKLQADSFVSCDENLKEEYASEQVQLADKHGDILTETSDMVSEQQNTESNSSRSINDTHLSTANFVNNIDTLSEIKLTSGCEAIECDAESNRNGENTDISTDAAAVSPRGYAESSVINMQSMNHVSPREDLTEESKSVIGGYESVAGNQNGEFSGANQPDEAYEIVIGTGTPNLSIILWFETFAFLSTNMKWGDFLIFIRRLAARTNVTLLERIDVELEHKKEENQSCKSAIHDVMKTWRQETPKATLQDLMDALKECTLNLTCEQLKNALIQKGSFPVYDMGQSQETVGRQFRFCSELAVNIDSEIGHQMKELKVQGEEIFC